MSDVRVVLVVEDDLELLSALEEIISEPGYSSLSAANGETALALVKASKVDIILSDDNMPIMSGTELFQTIRREGYSIPFVLHSGKLTRLEAQALVNCEHLTFLSKPATFEEIKVVLDRLAAGQSA